MKEDRDFVIVSHINEHYSDLKNDLDTLDSHVMFSNSKDKRRAILFDFLQMGELTNQLSKSFFNSFNNNGAIRLIAIRNRIVHGYSTLRADLIFSTLKNDLPKYINELNVFSRDYYFKLLKQYLGKEAIVVDNKPLKLCSNSVNFVIESGHLDSFAGLNGKFQEVYIIVNPIVERKHSYKVIAIIHYCNSEKDKLIVTNDSDLFLSKTMEQEIEIHEGCNLYSIIENSKN